MATNQNTRTTIVNELGRIFGRIAKEQLQHLTVADLIKLKSLFSEHKKKERSSKTVPKI